jgi:hypothetical protein
MRRRSWKLGAGSHSNSGESRCMLRHTQFQKPGTPAWAPVREQRLLSIYASLYTTPPED